MGPTTNHLASLRYVAALTAIALLAIIALNKSFGAQSTQQKESVSTNTETSALMAAQAPLLTAANRIKNLDPKGTGLGGIRLQVDKHVLEVWWKGELPAAVRKEIAKQERNNGIKVLVQPAQYSQRELIEKSRSIMSKATEYPGLVSAGPSVDGSGLEIGLTDTTRAASLKFPVPIHAVLRTGLTQLSRANYMPPAAGAVTVAATSGALACSTGFSMTRASWDKGILTAEHCGCGSDPLSEVLFTTGVGTTIGTAEPKASKILHTDSLYVPTSIFGTATYDGGVGVGEFTKPVVGIQHNFPGMGVCTSGAGTGVHCGIFIQAVNQNVCMNNNCPGGACPGEDHIDGVSFAYIPDGTTAAVGNGDSGGPVFTLTGPSNSQVQAAGLIIFGFNPTPCQGFGTTCFNGLAFNDIDSLELAHDVRLLTIGGGGVTTVSLLVFAVATLLWVMVRLSRRTKTQSGA